MKIDEIRNMSTEDLIKASGEARAEILIMKRRLHMNEVQNPRTIRIKRRELARILTVLGEHLSKEKA